jgi:hypothetical protein
MAKLQGSLYCLGFVEGPFWAYFLPGPVEPDLPNTPNPSSRPGLVFSPTPIQKERQSLCLPLASKRQGEVEQRWIKTSLNMCYKNFFLCLKI